MSRTLALLGALLVTGIVVVPVHAGSYDPAQAKIWTSTDCPPQVPRPTYSVYYGMIPHPSSADWTAWAQYDYFNIHDDTSQTWFKPQPLQIGLTYAYQGGVMWVTNWPFVSPGPPPQFTVTLYIFHVTDGQPSNSSPIDSTATLRPQDYVLCSSPPSPSPSLSPTPLPSPTSAPVPSPSPTPISSPTPLATLPPASPTPTHLRIGTTAPPPQSTAGPAAATPTPHPSASSSPASSPTSIAIAPRNGSGSSPPPIGGGTPWWVFGALGGLVAASGLGLGGWLLLRHRLGWLPWFARS